MMPLLMALLLGTPALAASTLAELVAQTPNVVRGEVIHTYTFRDEGIFRTRYTIATSEVIRGAVRPEITITLAGGTIGNRTVIARDVPVWHEGNEVVLFLKNNGQPNPEGLFTVVDGALLDPVAERAADFPRLITELTTDLSKLPTIVKK